MEIQLTDDSLRCLVVEVVSLALAELDWPVGRLALSEGEAADSLGVPRSVLRDLRLRGILRATKLGRRVVYTRTQLQEGLARIQAETSSSTNSEPTRRRRTRGD